MGVLGVLLLVVGLSHCQRSRLDIYVSQLSEWGTTHSDFNSSLATEEEFCIKTVFDGPVIIIAPSLTSESLVEARGNLKLTAYYADKGLRTVAEYANFQPLHQLLLSTRHLSGLVYPSAGFNNRQILNSVIEKIVVPDTYRTIDLLHNLRKTNTHVLYVTPSDFFNVQGFLGLVRVGKYLVDEFTIEDLSTKPPKLPVKQNPLNSTTEEPQKILPNTIHQEWNRPSGFLIPIYSAPSYIIEQELYRRYRHVSPFSLRIARKK